MLHNTELVREECELYEVKVNDGIKGFFARGFGLLQGLVRKLWTRWSWSN